MSIHNSTSIIFEPLSERWYLRLDDQSWNVSTPIDAATLCGFFPLHVEMSEYGLSTPSLGHVKIADVMEGSIKLSFHSQVNNTEIQEARDYNIARVSTGSVLFTEGYFADGWVGTQATLQYANLGSLGLRLYLPTEKALREKQVTISVNGRVIDTLDLSRGTPTDAAIPIPPEDRSGGEIELSASYREAVRGGEDIRDLGFILVAANKDDTNWEKVESV